MLAEDVHFLSQDICELVGGDGSERRGRWYPWFELVHELEQLLGEPRVEAGEHGAFRRQSLSNHGAVGKAGTTVKTRGTAGERMVYTWHTFQERHIGGVCTGNGES